MDTEETEIDFQRCWEAKDSIAFNRSFVQDLQKLCQ